MNPLSNGRPQGVSITIAPLDEVWDVSQLTTAKGPCVLVKIKGPYGLVGHYLGPDEALAIGEHLAKLGRAAKADLIIPPKAP